MPKQLNSLIDITQRRCDDAARRLGSVMARARESERKRDVLVQYREDYRARLDRMVRESFDAAELRNFRGFLARMDEAVAQQEAEVVHWCKAVDEARENWNAEQRQVNSFSAVRDRKVAVLSRQQLRRERKLEDEFAARRFAGLGSGFAFAK